jgi:hypothetical protein
MQSGPQIAVGAKRMILSKTEARLPQPKVRQFGLLLRRVGAPISPGQPSEREENMRGEGPCGQRVGAIEFADPRDVLQRRPCGRHRIVSAAIEHQQHVGAHDASRSTSLKPGLSLTINPHRNY